MREKTRGWLSNLTTSLSRTISCNLRWRSHTLFMSCFTSHAGICALLMTCIFHSDNEHLCLTRLVNRGIKSLYLIHNRCTVSRRNFPRECHEWLTWQLLSEFYLHYDLSIKIFQSHSQEWWASQRLSSKLSLSTSLQRMKKMRLALSISNHWSSRNCCSIAFNSMIDLSLKLSQSNFDSQVKMSSLT